jgi:hypothetical protein
VPGDDNKFKNAKERELHRYEFIEWTVRIALCKYKDPKLAGTLAEATENLIKNEILPNCQAIEGVDFRMKHLYNIECDTFFKN